MSSCLPVLVNSPGSISSPADLHLPVPSSPVVRNGSRLLQGNTTFRAVGANVYWLGLDENVVPNPSYPAQVRVLEIMAIVASMGGNTIRSTTLGVSVGSSLSMMPSPSARVVNQAAFVSIDFAVYAAKMYGLRLIIPLIDQYDYYHGGIPSFLRSRSLPYSNPAVDYAPFYNQTSTVFSDFTFYVNALLTHRSTITNLTLANDPTILAIETGNELGGFGLTGYAPPVAWTKAIAAQIKNLSSTSGGNVLVMSGTYGIGATELAIDQVDFSNHFYPPSISSLQASATLTGSNNKVMIVGEFDWNDSHSSRPYIYVVVIVPILLAIIIWFLPARWFSKSSTEEEKYESKGESVDGLVAGFPPSSLPPVARLTGRRSRFNKQRLLSGFVLLLAPILAIVIHSVLPPAAPLSSFLNAIENSQVGGSFYWSLFGRDNTCCNYVDHNDGFTLHYPSEPGSSDGSGDVVRQLSNHALTMSGSIRSQFSSLNSMPAVTCPQKALVTV